MWFVKKPFMPQANKNDSTHVLYLFFAIITIQVDAVVVRIENRVKHFIYLGEFDLYENKKVLKHVAIAMLYRITCNASPKSL